MDKYIDGRINNRIKFYQKIFLTEVIYGDEMREYYGEHWFKVIENQFRMAEFLLHKHLW